MADSRYHYSSDSRESSPATPVSSAAAGSETIDADQKLRSPFLRLPVDIFKCVTDYLSRDAAWSLKRVCRGLAQSRVVDRLLYRYPIQLNDVRDIRLCDWKYRNMGQTRWLNFQSSINDTNRPHVRKLAMSHWASIADFEWIEENLPSLTCLDLSAIKDFVWTPEETWTWKQLADACPKLFARIEELEVSNWADYTAHSRIEYSYSYNDYRFKPRFRISRRRDGGSIAKMVFPRCTQLKTLAIREQYSGFHTWNEWEVHQRVCCLVDGVSKYCPPTLSKLRVHDYAPFRSLFSTDASAWENLSELEIGLYSWMEDRRDRDVIGPINYRITQGHQHRDEEAAFDDKTFDTCERNHMTLGTHVVEGSSASFEDLLHNLRTISGSYPNIRVKPINPLRDIVIHPFHLVNVTQRRSHHGQQRTNIPAADPVSSPDVQHAIRWLAQQCDWKPILAWDSMMCDVFPANLEPNRTFLPKADVLSRIQSMVRTLKELGIPIRLSIGDRHNTCPNSGLDGSLYFGDYKCFVGEGDDKHEVLAATQSRFNLSGIAPLVDELTIQYPVDVPGVAGWSRTSSKRQTEGKKELLNREKTGWRRFWKRYAPQFKNLKKLTAMVPNDIYNDWGRSEELRALFGDDRWELLEVGDKFLLDKQLFGYLPFSSIRYGLTRKRPSMKFVQHVFFRLDQKELDLASRNLSEDDNEAFEISDEEVAFQENLPVHRFWPAQTTMAGKRKGEDDDEKAEVKVAKRVKVGATV
ncbi:hypothetical protein EJ04DRAFT_427782 [Polyplosphaeria fusca]|uniref:F-box domain-containing protein n=1 Tax=Polyplosphaeria fusca TaxID=682080 RepID=A0A9P4R6H7_9PLEO|nr:hypothetical protein EJ04DRAFT_427782 [Polyplosphaeria fusca]